MMDHQRKDLTQMYHAIYGAENVIHIPYSVFFGRGKNSFFSFSASLERIFFRPKIKLMRRIEFLIGGCGRPERPVEHRAYASICELCSRLPCLQRPVDSCH